MVDLTFYMMDNVNMIKCLDNVNTEKKIKSKPKRKIKENKYFIPFQEDKLFWIFYYMKYGYLEYNLVGSNSYSTEVENKIKLTDEIKKNKNIFKEYKLQKINDSINELLCNSEITFKTFLILCILNNISFIYSVNKIYFNLQFDDAEEMYLIHLNNGFYGCEKIDVKNVEIYKTNRFEIKYYEKAIYSSNTYNMEQIIDICNQLDVSLLNNEGKKRKKEDLYNNILEKISIFYNTKLINRD